MSEDDQNISLRYWKAAISALPTAEKRDAAWEFFLARFAGSNAGDTLSGLILLLEANGVFLLTLPEKFHGELIRPITDRLSAMREQLQANVESQRATVRVADTVNEEIEKANRQLANTSAEFADKIAAAAKQLDTAALASQVCRELESSIVSPLRLALRTLPQESKRIEAASKAAESSIEKWHKVHFRGIIFNVCIGALLFFGMLFELAWIWLEHRFEDRLAAEIVQMSGNHYALRETALLNAPVRLTSWCDSDGNPIPGGYALELDHAEDAQLQTADGERRGLIFFKARRSDHESKALRQKVSELMASAR
jgi:hypothetical protein